MVFRKIRGLSKAHGVTVVSLSSVFSRVVNDMPATSILKCIGLGKSEHLEHRERGARE